MEIINYPNYLIYDDGRIWSKYKNIFLKPYKETNGYMRVHLYNVNQKSFSIHRLVGLHYIPNPNNYPTVDHKNNIRDDNRLCNLRWASLSMQQINQLIPKNNKSGHKNISYYKSRDQWRVQYERYKIQKYFECKIDAICYKFIIQLKIASHLI